MDTSEKLKEVTQALLQELFFYDFQTGELTRRKCLDKSPPINSRNLVGKAAGSLGELGYLRISIGGKRIMAHRLVWLYVKGTWPKNQIDHINGNRSDNRIENLREATCAENSQNRNVLQKNNTSGFTGVQWNKAYNKWVARIRISRKTIHLGYFDSKEDAMVSRIEAKKKYHLFDSVQKV